MNHTQQATATIRNLAQIRMEAGITQEQLAARLGVNQQRISAMEAAEDMQLSTLYKWEAALDELIIESKPRVSWD